MDRDGHSPGTPGELAIPELNNPDTAEIAGNTAGGPGGKAETPAPRRTESRGDS